jgi:hypothetical protein
LIGYGDLSTNDNSSGGINHRSSYQAIRRLGTEARYDKEGSNRE